MGSSSSRSGGRRPRREAEVIEDAVGDAIASCRIWECEWIERYRKSQAELASIPAATSAFKTLQRADDGI
jgi:hypothetical protein